MACAGRARVCPFPTLRDTPGAALAGQYLAGHQRTRVLVEFEFLVGTRNHSPELFPWLVSWLSCGRAGQPGHDPFLAVPGPDRPASPVLEFDMSTDPRWKDWRLRRVAGVDGF